MLPGFRFLVAAIVLSMSLLIFALGAAALLRAAHEEFASNPSWRGTPEMTFAQPVEATRTVLAALRVDSPAEDERLQQDDAPASMIPAEETATAPVSTDSTEPIATQAGEQTSLPLVANADAMTAETPVAENTAAGEAAPAEKPAAAEEVQIASIEASKISSSGGDPQSGSDPQPTAESEPVEVRPAPTADVAATKIAAQGGPAAKVENPPKSKVSTAKPGPAQADQSAVGKRVQAKHASRRKIATARARLAAQQAQQQLQPNLFYQQPQPATRAH
jgi:hypothetical protein